MRTKKMVFVGLVTVFAELFLAQRCAAYFATILPKVTWCFTTLGLELVDFACLYIEEEEVNK